LSRSVVARSQLGRGRRPCEPSDEIGLSEPKARCTGGIYGPWDPRDIGMPGRVELSRRRDLNAGRSKVAHAQASLALIVGRILRLRLEPLSLGCALPDWAVNSKKVRFSGPNNCRRSDRTGCRAAEH
jgi:hypothetical protein